MLENFKRVLKKKIVRAPPKSFKSILRFLSTVLHVATYHTQTHSSQKKTSLNNRVMGLFEVIQRVATRLGLASKLVRILPGLSLISALAGVILLLTIPMSGQYRNTYISENALLPAQAQTYFRESEWNLVRGYREEVHELESKSSSE